MDSKPDLRNNTLNPVALLLLAPSMSADAFSVTITKGAALNPSRFSQALKIGLIFGAIEASAPVIGWFIGHSAADYAEAWEHWIAFFTRGYQSAYAVRRVNLFLTDTGNIFPLFSISKDSTGS